MLTYNQSEYEPFWAAAAALDLPLSLHTATQRQGKILGAGDKSLRDASRRATKAFYPALSMCDLILSGVLERHPASHWPSSSSSWRGRRAATSARHCGRPRARAAGLTAPG
jgi:hypothetical protein